MRDKAVFRLLYGILVAAMILLTDYAVVYVQANIDEYEASQPEYVVEEVTERLKKAAKEGKAAEMFTFPDIVISPYETELYDDYLDKVTKASVWTWKILSGSYSETNQIYGLYGDDELLAKLSLKCSDSKILMEILTANTWEEGEIYPVLTLKRYTEYIDIPNDFSAKLNGIDVKKDSEGVTWTEKNGHIIYCIENLYGIKDVKIYDKYGKECKTKNSDGYFTADTTSYNLILPEQYIVKDDGNTITGKAVETGIQYEFVSSSDSIIVEDGYGNEIEYKNGDIISANDVSFCVPDNFNVVWKNINLEEFETGREEIPIYREYESLANMPKLVRYEIKGLFELPKLEITDNLGLPVAYEFVGNKFEIYEQTTIPEIPQDVLEEVDLIEITKKWSLFTSDDLEGKRHGFDELKKYLVPDTDFYIQAEKYSKSIDITFISNHQNTEFVDEKASDYVKYSDDLFACDIYLDKKMYINQTKKNINDRIKGTYYFYKYNGSWCIAGQRAKTETVEE